MKKGKKPILLLDFDGVIHSYTSGWKGATNIPDPPVPGALEFIVEAVGHFDVQIYSSRSRQWGGKRAMKKWLKIWFHNSAPSFPAMPHHFSHWLTSHVFAEKDWYEDVETALYHLFKEIKFPTKKPAAFLTIDDRAMRFTGTFFSMAELKNFRPWYSVGPWE